MNRSEKTLICKDINEMISSKRVIIPVIIFLIIFSVIMPLIILVIAHFSESDPNAIGKVADLLEKLPTEYSTYNASQLLIKIMIDLMFPTFFLLIPIMSSGVIAASSFVGEKEHKTLETLLYTPISMQELLRAKILSVFVASCVLTLISFIFLAIIFNIGGFIYFGKFIFPDIKWVMILLWISPTINLLSLTFTVIISAKSNTFQEAQQVSGLLVIPIVLFLVAQMINGLMVSNLVVFIVGAVLLVFDIILMKIVASKFVSEKLL